MLALGVWSFGHRGGSLRLAALFGASTSASDQVFFFFFFFCTIAPYVASQLITQEKLAEDAAEQQVRSSSPELNQH